jgi:hypothetical protein
MLREVMDEHAASLNRAWSHDRSKTIGASEIGACARKVFATKFQGTKKGVKPDEEWTDQWGARVRGTIMENAFWAPAMKARFGDNLVFAGAEQKTMKLGYLSATPDALIINQPRDALASLGIPDMGSDCFMAEAKSIDPRTNIVEAKTENFFQTQVQMGLMRETSEYKPNYNVLTYSDASFWNEVIEFPIEFDPNIYQAAKDRATTIMTAENFSEMPPEGWIAGGKECSFCPFVKACGVERRSVPRENKAASPQFIAEIADYARQANTIKQLLLNAEKQERELEQLIKDRMREKGVRRIQNVVNWYPVAGQHRYSATKMKERLIELGEDPEDFATDGEPSDRLVIAAVPAALPGVLIPGKLKKRKTKTVKAQTKKAKTTNGKSSKSRTAGGRKLPAAGAGRAHGKRGSKSSKPAGNRASKSAGRKRK